MMRFLLLPILALAPSLLLADPVSVPKPPEPLSEKSLKTLMQLAPLNGLLARISQNASSVPPEGTDLVLSDYDAGNNDLLLEHCRYRVLKDIDNTIFFSNNGKILDVGCLSSSKLPEDIELATRALKQDNDFGRSNAISSLFAMGAKKEAIAGLQLLALDVRSNQVYYQIAAATQLVEMGKLEWLGVLVDYAATDSLNRLTGLQFSEVSGWKKWWLGVREGNRVSDELVLSPEWESLRKDLINRPWYAKLNQQPNFEKRFFSKDSGAPGQGVFEESICPLQDESLRTSCLRWYSLEMRPIHKDRFQSVQLRAMMNLWDSGIPICLGDLPKTLDLPDMVLQLDSKENRKQLRNLAKSGDEVWRAWTVRYLMVIGDKDTVDLATDLLNSENPFVLWSVADALSHAGKEQTALPILQKLSDNRVHYYGSLASGRIGAINSGTFKPFNVKRCR